ncbi:exonuclease of the beta-lactamase fold involved in RNA processing-like protein [Asticcacaulis biprosthecium C19]|uniref:Exonuclease of the beta-lactamase fold involved in RNA processing-like protein n=1 Tax=Asticcacaulis biprosthecium C19 TaxID=715226 RepID=F4QPG2_9CAUL|nr:ligase-associated DNA damage response exonuclease [Asticcacaulis biprosthecium]EGF91220.1 exonuclease of the beta-lactamase fold involved in RNA processing-like protein [Asticcacaulis biprosthecium C19]
MTHPRDWIEVRKEGVFCKPGGFFIDPMHPAEIAVVTHGHADHARAGHGDVFATYETLAIMRARYGETHATIAEHPLTHGQAVDINGVKVSLHPAGHILGSSQARLEYNGATIVFSGDYKRRADPTCVPFEPVPCDVFVTEATFALPVFRHPPLEDEIVKLLTSLRQFPERCHLVGVYALGKCQRMMVAMRRAGYGETIYLHGAMVRLCELYRDFGIDLGPWDLVTPENAKTLAGKIVLCPPSALQDRWSRKLPDVLTVAASGWMRIRARAKQKGVELPLVVSDHADWDELLQTLSDVGAPEIWVTHGRDDALVYAAQQMGLKAQALHLIGYEDDSE